MQGLLRRVPKPERNILSISQTSPPSTQRSLPRVLRVSAWASFVLNVLIIGTGGAVRLTGSGLGCSEWPLCTPDSLVPTRELGIHGLIEFGNRTISGPLLIAAILVVWFSWRIREHRRDLFTLSVVVLSLVIVQAIVGGFVVWESLSALLVGFHYTVSLIIVCITAAYLVRMKEAGGTRERSAPRGFAITTHVMSAFMAVLIVMGVLTTGSGPHSGDANVVRQGFDATLLSHLHAWPGYITLALVLALLVWADRAHLPQRTWLTVLLLLMVVQIMIGIYQARNGLPPLAVGAHMVLASLTAATLTTVVIKLKHPTRAV